MSRTESVPVSVPAAAGINVAAMSGRPITGVHRAAAPPREGGGPERVTGWHVETAPSTAERVVLVVVAVVLVVFAVVVLALAWSAPRPAPTSWCNDGQTSVRCE